MSALGYESRQNRRRRESGDRLFRRYRSSLGSEGEEQSDLEELLCDLLHLCDLRGLRFAEALVEAAAEKRRGVLGELEESFGSSQSAQGQASDGGAS